MIIIKGKIGTAPIGNGNLDTIGGRGLRLVKNPNMDYTFLYTRILFRDIMIILVVNVGRVGIQIGHYHYNGAGIVRLSYASNFHYCDFDYLIIEPATAKFRDLVIVHGDEIIYMNIALLPEKTSVFRPVAVKF